MKYISSILSISLIVASLTACDFLDEYDPNSTTKGNYYTSEDDISSSVSGVYGSLSADYYYGKNSFYFTDVHAHSTIYNSSGTNGGIPYQFYNFTLNEENSYISSRYTQLYRTISRANTVLAHLDDVSYADSSTRDTYEAEVRFVRALTYFHLVTEWGDVPLVLKKLETTDEVSAANYRRPKSEVYQAIFDDLEYVINSPLQNLCPAKDCGRTSKAAAYALAGKVWLQYACDEDFSEEKTSSLQHAIQNLTAAWELRSFNSLSDIPYKNLWDLSTQKSCAEHIFQINFIQGNETLGSDWNYSFGPKAEGITSMHTGSQNNFTSQEIYDQFDPSDIRRSYLRSFVNGGITYYHTMKYVDLDCGVNGYGGNNWIVLRYADVVLMLAEANYWSGDETQARSYLNMVRKRAGLSNWSGSDLRQGIYDERLFEFIHEGLRWQDMLRMYTREEMIAHYSAINANFTQKELLFPIPYRERILNTEGLYQNPGY
jgi:hypothetical protein